MLRAFTVLSLAGALAAAGCARRSEPLAGAAAPSKVAIRMGDEVITVDEIDKRIATELFELRSTAMRSMLVDRLLQRESQRRGVDLATMHRQEIEAQVAAPSDDEGAKALAEWVAAGRLKPEDAARMSPGQAAERLRSVRLNQAEEAFYDRLMKEQSVRVDFGALGKPALELAMDGPTLGPASAPLKIVEFADLSKPPTSIWQGTLEKLVDKYQARVQFRFKQKPSAPDSDGAKLAEAALCADDQGHYWDFRKALFKNKEASAEATLLPSAKAAGLNVETFQACVSSGAKKSIVASNAREAAQNRIEGEPVLSINGILVSGAQDLATVERLLRLESGVL